MITSGRDSRQTGPKCRWRSCAAGPSWHGGDRRMAAWLGLDEAHARRQWPALGIKMAGSAVRFHARPSSKKKAYFNLPTL